MFMILYLIKRNDHLAPVYVEKFRATKLLNIKLFNSIKVTGKNKINKNLHGEIYISIEIYIRVPDTLVKID